MACAVVASSGVLNGSRCGASIDSHEIVIRMNLAPSIGHEVHVGYGSTIQLVNSHVGRQLRASASLRRAVCAENVSLLFFGDLWLPSDDETKLVQDFNSMRCRYPHVLGRKALKLSEHVGAFRGSIPAIFGELLRAARKPRRKVPSAGFYAVHAALGMCASVRLFGFNGGFAAAAASFHYWRSPEPKPTEGFAATAFHHELELEHGYYRELAARARVRPLRLCLNHSSAAPSEAQAAGTSSPVDVKMDATARALSAAPEHAHPRDSGGATAESTRLSNRTLVCLIGSLRGGSVTWDSLRAHVLQPLRADLAILASFDESDALLQRLAPTHLWRLPEFADWAVLLDELLPAGWRQRVHLSHNLWGPLGGMRGSGAIIFALRLVLLRDLEPSTAFHGLPPTFHDLLSGAPPLPRRACRHVGWTLLAAYPHAHRPPLRLRTRRCASRGRRGDRYGGLQRARHHGPAHRLLLRRPAQSASGAPLARGTASQPDGCSRLTLNLTLTHTYGSWNNIPT